jgi:hypothetical protein
MHKASHRFFISIVVALHSVMPATLRAAEQLSAEQWQQLTDDKAFAYRTSKEAIQQPKVGQPGIISKILQGLFAFFGSGIGSLMLWVIVLGIVGFILYKLFISKDSFLFGKQKKRLGSDEDSGANEEDITSTDWEAQMQQAIKANDLRQAVRYSYMWLLRLMQQGELINYRIDKTNHDYYAELNDTQYKQSFRQLSRQYEYVWYGKYPISDAGFNGYLEQFNNLKNQLQQ